MMFLIFRTLALAVFLISCLVHSGFASEGRPVARTILAFYNSQEEGDVRATRIHRLAEMPLNHLGLVVKYRDIQQPLPADEEMEGVRGILTWFLTDKMPDPLKFMRWGERMIGHGRRFVFMGNLGVNRDRKNRETPLSEINRFLGRLGLRTEDNWKQITYDVRLIRKDPGMVEFERPYKGVLPPFSQIWRLDETTTSYLVAGWGKDLENRSDLVVIGPRGAYTAPGYSFFETGDFLQWYLNPFEFFRRAFDTGGLPKPDPNTLSGRRIYYSHIDGDGWRNISEIEKYKIDHALSAEVVLKEALEPFPDLPVTVAPIAADIDEDWFGTEESRRVAQEIFALPQVEAGSHTYSHPYFWKYYEHYRPEKEWREFVQREKKDNKMVHQRYARYLPLPAAKGGPGPAADETPNKKIIPGIYEIPRAYLDFPFDLDKEIKGSVDFINELLPPGKKVEIVQWSGDTSPFPAALEKTHELGLRNLNGGDSRFDPQYPSHAWVPPVGIQVGGQLQVYASTSNENTYTDLWEGRYFGFKHLVWTLRNTESPRRLKPFNIYYHMYSGEKKASLNALLANLHLAREQELAPVTTSHYAGIAEGFFSTRFVRTGPRAWRVEGRGALQTIRFDKAAALAVDLKKSRGVIGLRHYQGSLYVALDAAELSPVIVLKDPPNPGPNPPADRPYLIQSRWRVWKLEVPARTRASFTTQGFGEGTMAWKVSVPGSYRVELSDDKEIRKTVSAVAGEDGVLEFKFPPQARKPVRITLQWTDDVL